MQARKTDCLLEEICDQSKKPMMIDKTLLRHDVGVVVCVKHLSVALDQLASIGNVPAQINNGQSDWIEKKK